MYEHVEYEPHGFINKSMTFLLGKKKLRILKVLRFRSGMSMHTNKKKIIIIKSKNTSYLILCMTITT